MAFYEVTFETEEELDVSDIFRAIGDLDGVYEETIEISIDEEEED